MAAPALPQKVAVPRAIPTHGVNSEYNHRGSDGRWVWSRKMMSKDTGLTDLVVAITGASSGIGAATARAFVDAGAKVVLGARRRDRLDELVHSLGPHARAITTDVSDPDDCRRLVATAVAEFGSLDVLVANAGVGMYGSVLDHSDEEVRMMLDTNMRARFGRSAQPYPTSSRGGGVTW